MSEKVVLIHAIFLTSRCMASLARYLTHEGYDVLNIDYPSTRYPLEQLVDIIHPEIQAFIGDAPVHFVGYSMGGLLARAYLTRYRPKQLQTVVMLGTPNQGSEVASFIKDWRLYKYAYGPAGQQLVTNLNVPEGLLGEIDYPLGIVAGTFTIDPICYFLIKGPNDGKVSVESTKVKGMTAHTVMPYSHTMLPYKRKVHQLTAQFLKHGQF